MHPVGFEPTPPKRTELESVALDHSATDAIEQTARFELATFCLWNRCTNHCAMLAVVFHILSLPHLRFPSGFPTSVSFVPKSCLLYKLGVLSANSATAMNAKVPKAAFLFSYLHRPVRFTCYAQSVQIRCDEMKGHTSAEALVRVILLSACYCA